MTVLAHGGTGGAVLEGAFLLFPVAAFFLLSRWSRRQEQTEADPAPGTEPGDETEPGRPPAG